jgi:catechol 2,3-dioxygenase-like lactoylglutathione lyase family enzyme
VGICRIEEVSFGVEDVAECVRFFTDFGLEEVESGTTGATFRTPVGQHLFLRTASDASLPPALEAGSTLREVVWGVDSDQARESLGENLSRDREVTEDARGGLHTRDHTGFGVGLRVAEPIEVTFAQRRATNATGSVQRWNTPLGNYGQAHPLRVCHVAFFIPDGGHEEAIAFYVGRLNFRITDQLLDMGTFMQCEGDDDQHNLLLGHKADRAGINHLAYEVRDFDEVAEGGNYMIRAGWREARRLGRHTIGSNVFRFFHAPCGGRVEYAADMDRVDESYGPNVYEQRPPHHLWMLTSHGDKEPE